MAGTEGTHGTDDWDSLRDEPLETAQLSLAGQDDRLPWLAGADDDDAGDADDNSGLIRLALIAFAVLALLIAGIWWITHRAANPDVAADGSLVQAEPGPYKVSPSNPGGKQFAGTGDSSFAVSEGQNRPARLGGSNKVAPAPSETPSAAPTGKPASAAAPAAAQGGVGVQVGAYSSKAAAEAGWSKLVAQSGGALSGVSHRVLEGTADNGTIYRLQAVAGDAAGANALCARLKSAGIACQVK